MLTYLLIFRAIIEKAVDVWPERGVRWSFIQDFIKDMKRYGRVSLSDVGAVLLIAVVLTVLRAMSTTYLLKPLAYWMKFTPKNKKKFPESAWKFLYYFSIYTYTCILLFGKQYRFYSDPKTCWTEWFVGMPIPFDIYYLYCIQTSFYVHSVYATLFMDIWRKDSIAMLIHHFLTVFLLSFSYAVRYYKVGVLVLFLHDVCDVFLEFTKICVCWKIRDNKKHYWPEVLINLGFLAFTFTWFYFRLYVFPYKVLYPTGKYAIELLPDAPFYYFFNGLLLFLFAMDLWWFHFIIMLVYRVLTGQSNEVEDTREVGTAELLNSEDDEHPSNGVSPPAHLVRRKNGAAAFMGSQTTNSHVEEVRHRQKESSTER
ncbi:ceramide synthase 1-like isoform X2 [Xenia sp. Carnegie-2017]|uniref:ceramide synthase 1-like isoform X2 n=1 Tax=Xenia sp. Carnegie-2017 TaxID=2897299 RepID=UPI001F04CF45|nr:ceramide synthase 1-like isoform X2 [Xenia sp. Carnegie-2017]